MRTHGINIHQTGCDRPLESSDEAIFQRAQNGDHDAFGLLVQRHQDGVYRLALKILRHPQEAQDAAQQAFLRVWQKRLDYNDRWRFRTWLYRIVTNICIDEYRRRQRRPPAPQGTLESLPAAHCPQRDSEARELNRALNNALAKLSIEIRITLMLCYMEGLTYGEIARIRGVSVHTVKSRLRRGKEQMRQHLVNE